MYIFNKDIAYFLKSGQLNRYLLHVGVIFTFLFCFNITDAQAQRKNYGRTNRNISSFPSKATKRVRKPRTNRKNESSRIREGNRLNRAKSRRLRKQRNSKSYARLKAARLPKRLRNNYNKTKVFPGRRTKGYVGPAKRPPVRNLDSKDRVKNRSRVHSSSITQISARHRGNYHRVRIFPGKRTRGYAAPTKRAPVRHVDSKERIKRRSRAHTHSITAQLPRRLQKKYHKVRLFPSKRTRGYAAPVKREPVYHVDTPQRIKRRARVHSYSVTAQLPKRLRKKYKNVRHFPSKGTKRMRAPEKREPVYQVDTKKTMMKRAWVQALAIPVILPAWIVRELTKIARFPNNKRQNKKQYTDTDQHNGRVQSPSGRFRPSNADRRRNAYKGEIKIFPGRRRRKHHQLASFQGNIRIKRRVQFLKKSANFTVPTAKKYYIPKQQKKFGLFVSLKKHHTIEGKPNFEKKKKMKFKYDSRESKIWND